MAYDVVKQTHPGAPAAIGARVREKISGREGHIVSPRAGDAGVRVKFDGQFMPASCDPLTIEYASEPPAPAPPWQGR
ncbi:hypothetical protein BHAOGJBA_6044 [Methylobacterium hispanicum]|uniref:Uncharacterized protein n=1 Tax=Methylobacterium hispanicum TaxID=270350 RepID=A0AAV4ZZR1_9HYPH|nr:MULTISPECIES: hypothetical protein [Methylobacterium]GJD92490.1 hypothetical protein BHAOGJBA_6044 [Methylobacterium hispanicum]